MILNNEQVETYCYNSGFRNVSLQAAIKIVKCESSNNTNAHNTNGEDSRGLFQINLNAHPEYYLYDLFNPQINCDVAFNIYTNANNTFQDWTCAGLLGLVDPEKKFKITIAFVTGIIIYLLS